MDECGAYKITKRLLLRKGIDGFGSDGALVRLESLGGTAPLDYTDVGQIRWSRSKTITFALCDNSHPGIFQRGTDEEGAVYEQSVTLDFMNLPERFHDTAILWTIACLGHLRLNPETPQFIKEMEIRPLQEGEIGWTYSSPEAMWNGQYD